MSGDQDVFDERRHANRRTTLHIILVVIVAWNVLFIPLGVYLWPRLSRPALSPPIRLSVASVAPATSAVGRPAVPTTQATSPINDPLVEDFGRLLSQLGTDAIDPAELAKIAASARQRIENADDDLSLDSILDGLGNLLGGAAKIAPTTSRESVAPTTGQAGHKSADAEKNADEHDPKDDPKDGEKGSRKDDQGNADFAMSDIGFKVTQKNDQAWRYAWRFSITNKTKAARTFACYVRFLDAEGIVIADAFKMHSFPAGLTESARGTTLIKLPYARDVVDVEVIASPR